MLKLDIRTPGMGETVSWVLTATVSVSAALSSLLISPLGRIVVNLPCFEASLAVYVLIQVLYQRKHYNACVGRQSMFPSVTGLAVTATKCPIPVDGGVVDTEYHTFQHPVDPALVELEHSLHRVQSVFQDAQRMAIMASRQLMSPASPLRQPSGAESDAITQAVSPTSRGVHTPGSELGSLVVVDGCTSSQVSALTDALSCRDIPHQVEDVCGERCVVAACAPDAMRVCAVCLLSHPDPDASAHMLDLSSSHGPLPLFVAPHPAPPIPSAEMRRVMGPLRPVLRRWLPWLLHQGRLVCGCLPEGGEPSLLVGPSVRGVQVTRAPEEFGDEGTSPPLLFSLQKCDPVMPILTPLKDSSGESVDSSLSLGNQTPVRPLLPLPSRVSTTLVVHALSISGTDIRPVPQRESPMPSLQRMPCRWAYPDSTVFHPLLSHVSDSGVSQGEPLPSLLHIQSGACADTPTSPVSYTEDVSPHVAELCVSTQIQDAPSSTHGLTYRLYLHSLVLDQGDVSVSLCVGDVSVMRLSVSTGVCTMVTRAGPLSISVGDLSAHDEVCMTLYDTLRVGEQVLSIAVGSVGYGCYPLTVGERPVSLFVTVTSPEAPQGPMDVVIDACVEVDSALSPQRSTLRRLTTDPLTRRSISSVMSPDGSVSLLAMLEACLAEPLSDVAAGLLLGLVRMVVPASVACDMALSHVQWALLVEGWVGGLGLGVFWSRTPVGASLFHYLEEYGAEGPMPPEMTAGLESAVESAYDSINTVLRR
ncbi:hypothetical protein KIPB_002578 [Kipferlia bialata]|uniref:Uncharacterized protein n=1 Tax=Kipferlia bialata TaxID=797122 RepID=A0A391NSJ9_9EUKA|nr:hypothetical protein KIPB_000199 [Kipferlia bialata]GCA62288.1 hypothetical protein KIPB_002578 [Kipferlia bialata]|eukprot:g199.t1